jgi:pimeloyl-ACP methyl ester carboxylesterase
LVGASGGGYIVSGFAEAHPAQVAGLVLVETHRAIVAGKAPKELLAELNCADSRNQEHRDYVAVENDAWAKKRRLGNFPMTVISNDFGNSPENAEDSTNVADSRGWLVLSPQAKQVVVTTGHDVAGNEPDVVAREILRVLAAARAR